MAPRSILHARAARHQPPELPRARSVATRFLGFLRAAPWQPRLHRAIGKEFRVQIEAKFFAHYLKEEPGSNSSGFDLPKHRKLFKLAPTAGTLRPLSAQGVPAHQPPSARRGPAQLERLNRTSHNRLRQRPGQSRPLPPSPHPAHLQRGLESGAPAHGRPALRHRPQRCRAVEAPVLKKDMDLTGEVLADIYAATTGTDNDMVVKLIDHIPRTIPTPRCAATS